MELKTKVKIGWTVLMVVAIVVVGVLTLRNSCEQPDDLDLGMVQLGCIMRTMNMSRENLEAQACEYLGRDNGCQFEESDRDKIVEFLNQLTYNCAKKELESKNLCTDKLPKGPQ
jgi:hypothetical protein